MKLGMAPDRLLKSAATNVIKNVVTRNSKITFAVRILFLLTMQVQIFGGRSIMGKRRGEPLFFLSAEIRRETDQTAAIWKEGRLQKGLLDRED